MTEERKNELLTTALKLIGTHMDEDENLPRALTAHLGMTADEMRECGIEAADAPGQSARQRLSQKVASAYGEYQTSWMSKTPAELIESASEIAAVQRMVAELVETASEDDAEYLLRFKNPLEVVSDAWYSANGPDAVIDEELSHILWELADRQDAETEYELEPEYRAAEPELSM